MKTKRIMKNAFITGIMFVTVALFFAPDNWWSRLLGVLAGICAGIISGYLLCDFQKTLQKVPLAWEKAKNGGTEIFDVVCIVVKWGVSPHPFAHLMILLTVLNTFVMLIILFITFHPIIPGLEPIIAMMFVGALMAFMSYMLMTHIASKNKFYWVEGIIFESYVRDYIEMRVTYWNVFCLVGLTIQETIKSCVYIIYKVAEFIAWNFWAYGFALICFLGRFVIHLFILVHSKERFIWTMDGILGGMIIYLWVTPPVLMGWDRIFLCTCGGLVGAGLGVFSSEVVTQFLKSFLKKNPAWQMR
jgi:hypothetical protein